MRFVLFFIYLSRVPNVCAAMTPPELFFVLSRIRVRRNYQWRVTGLDPMRYNCRTLPTELIWPNQLVLLTLELRLHDWKQDYWAISYFSNPTTWGVFKVGGPT